MSSSGFSWLVRVYYEDTDAGGVVFHANYLKFLERARTEWLRSLGFEQGELLKTYRTLFVVRQVVIDYLRPARLNDVLRIETGLLKLTGVSARFGQDIFLEKQIICSANTQAVCIHAETLFPHPIPKVVADALRCSGG